MSGLKVLACLRARSINKSVEDYRAPANCVMSNKRVLVLVNPVGGNGHAKRICDNIVTPMLRTAKCEVTVTKTTHSNFAKELGETIANHLLDSDEVQFDAVIVCSGDGMFSETMNGFVGTILNSSRTPPEKRELVHRLAFAPIPCGSSNGLATSGALWNTCWHK